MNEEQDRFWNEQAGPLWVEAEAETESHTGPFGEAALAVAAPAEGEAVLDVGCGCGSTTVTLAAAVGTGGRVLGADLSAPMLARAREKIDAAGAAHADLRRADAQSAELGTDAFDLVFSRFGVMFFSDPVAAFSNLRRALRPDGRMVFVCWQPPSANPWMSVVNRGAAQIFGLDAPPHDAPGPFSLADPAHTRKILEGARFGTVGIDPVELRLHLGAGQTVEDWVHQRLIMGTARSYYLDEPSDRQGTIRATLAERLAPYRTDAANPTSGLTMEGAAWIVSARP